MARFEVPLASEPSTPGSTRSEASPSTSPKLPSGPNTSWAPLCPGKPSTDGRKSRSPSESARSHNTGTRTVKVPHNDGTTTPRKSKSRSPSISPKSSGFRPVKRARSPDQLGDDAAYFPSTQHDRKKLKLRPARSLEQRRGGGDAAAFFAGVCGALGEEDIATSQVVANDNHDDIMDSPDDRPDHTADSTDQALEQPLVSYQPERLPGRFGVSQPKLNRSLTLLRERPGNLPTHTLHRSQSNPAQLQPGSPTSPSLDWSDGAAWRQPTNSTGTGDIAREIFHNDIGLAEAQSIADLFSHENLINIKDVDGFDAEQRDGVVRRKEVLYGFCAGGPLNRLIFSRRPGGLPPTEAPAIPGLPEDLVWHVLLSLLRAAQWLHMRDQPVVHCAIDPANVFFTAPPRPEESAEPLVRRYGVVKLGGFGRAVVLPHRVDPGWNDDGEVEERCAMFGHLVEEGYVETGFEAPEMVGMVGEEDVGEDGGRVEGEDGRSEWERLRAGRVREEKMVPGPCSDVFSIGATCLAMMKGKTVWDALLERRLVQASLHPGRENEREVVHEKWRHHSFQERRGLLEPILRGKERLAGSALPDFYSVELRGFVEGLVDLDPEVRGESAMLLCEAEELFYGKFVVGGALGRALEEEVREVWRGEVRMAGGGDGVECVEADDAMDMSPVVP